VLLVHGLWDSAERLSPLKVGLKVRGIDDLHALDLVPNDGRAPIAELGALVGRAVTSIAADGQVDIVGFSMGALVSRWYVQRGGGKERVRRFVSISGPHHGTKVALAAPFLAGVRDMRQDSDLLRDLASDTDPFGPVDVHCLYTPFDLLILPAKSAVLPTARSVREFRVPTHRSMVTNRRVLDHVAALLR
jgi:triacylglycerol lipase